MMSPMFDLLVEGLRTADELAKPRPDGVPTGLRWLHGHIDPSRGVHDRDITEDRWSDFLQEWFRGKSIAAEVRQPYDTDQSGDCSCDLVVATASQCWWIEVKRAYRE